MASPLPWLRCHAPAAFHGAPSNLGLGVSPLSRLYISHSAVYDAISNVAEESFSIRLVKWSSNFRTASNA